MLPPATENHGSRPDPPVQEAQIPKKAVVSQLEPLLPPKCSRLWNT